LRVTKYYCADPRKGRFKWAWHVARIGDQTSKHRVFFGKLAGKY